METNALHIVVSYSGVLETVWETIFSFLLARRNIETASLPTSNWNPLAWASLHAHLSRSTPGAFASRLHYDILRLIDMLACEQLVLTTEILIQLCMLPWLWDKPPSDSVFQTLRISRNRIVHQAAFQRLAADSARLLMFRIAETLELLSDGITGPDQSSWALVLERCKSVVLSMTGSTGKTPRAPALDRIAVAQQFDSLETHCKLLVRNAKSVGSSSEVESSLSYIRCSAGLLVQHGHIALDAVLGKNRYIAQKVLLALAQESTSSFSHLHHAQQLPLLAMLRAVLIPGQEVEQEMGGSGPSSNGRNTKASGSFVLDAFFKPSLQAALDPTLFPIINVEKRYGRVSGLGCLLSAVQQAVMDAAAAVQEEDQWIHRLGAAADTICAPPVPEHVAVVQAVNPWPPKVAVQANNDHVRSLLGLLCDAFSARQDSALTSTSAAALALPRTIADLENHKPFRTTAQFVVHVLIAAWAHGLQCGDSELCSAAGRCLKVACTFSDVALEMGKPRQAAVPGSQQPLVYIVHIMEDAVTKARRALHRLSDHYLLLKEAVEEGAGGGQGPEVHFAHAVMEPVVHSGEGCLPSYLRESLHSARCLLAHARSSFCAAMLSLLPRSLASLSHGQACVVQQVQLQGTRIYTLLTMNSFERWARSTLIDDKVARDEFWVAKKHEEAAAEEHARELQRQDVPVHAPHSVALQPEGMDPSVAAVFGFLPARSSPAAPILSADDIESALLGDIRGPPAVQGEEEEESWTAVTHGHKGDSAAVLPRESSYRNPWAVLSDTMNGRTVVSQRAKRRGAEADEYRYESWAVDEGAMEEEEEEEVLEAQDNGDGENEDGLDDVRSETEATSSSIGPSASERMRMRMLGRGTGKLHDLTDAYGRDLNYVPVNALIDDLRRHVALWAPSSIKLCIILPPSNVATDGTAGPGSGTMAGKGGGGGTQKGAMGASVVDELMKIVTGALLQEVHRHIMDWLWTCDVQAGTQAYNKRGMPEGAPLTFEAQTATRADEGKPTLVNVRFSSFESWLVDRVAGGPHKQSIDMEMPLQPYTRARPELPMAAAAKARLDLQGRGQDDEPAVQKLLPDVFRFCDALGHITGRLQHYDTDDMGASFTAQGKTQTAAINAKALPMGKSNSGGSTASTLSQSSRGANAGGRGASSTHNPATDGMTAVDVKQVRSIIARVCRESAILLSFNDQHAGYRT